MSRKLRTNRWSPTLESILSEIVAIIIHQANKKESGGEGAGLIRLFFVECKFLGCRAIHLSDPDKSDDHNRLGAVCRRSRPIFRGL